MKIRSDQNFQERPFKCSATEVEGKLLLEINDNITYKGEIESSPYYDLSELKAIF